MMGSQLPVFSREVYDNSVMSTHQGCPRKFYYQYHLCRAPAGLNFPIQFGIAYHKYRENLEMLYLNDSDVALWPRYHQVASAVCQENWQEPPLGHKHEWQTNARLRTTLNMAFDRWKMEKENNRLVVIHAERPFELTLPSGHRFGGRIDQLLEWNNKLWIRDFKTTSRMGASYESRFDPDNQMTGYTWGMQQLSGRPVEGVIIEVVYNTKTKGPEFFQFLTTRSQFHVESWLETVQHELELIELHKTKDVWPQRTGYCLNFGMCAFHEACQQSSWPSIDDWLSTETIESHWDFMNPDKEEGVTD